MAKIAFIGLGHMGGGMAPNLAKAGHEVRAFDLSEEALAHAVERGCTRAGSTEEAVKDADAVVTMLPAGKHVAEVYREPHLRPRAQVGDPDRLLDHRRRDRASRSRKKPRPRASRWSMRRCPGGIAAAEGGTLTFMVGGSRRRLREGAAVSSRRWARR